MKQTLFKCSGWFCLPSLHELGCSVFRLLTSAAVYGFRLAPVSQFPASRCWVDTPKGWDVNAVRALASPHLKHFLTLPLALGAFHPSVNWECTLSSRDRVGIERGALKRPAWAAGLRTCSACQRSSWWPHMQIDGDLLPLLFITDIFLSQSEDPPPTHWR